VFALHNVCSHGQARLSEGFVEADCVECPLHQGLVDIRTGEPRSASSTDPVRSYPTRLLGDRVEVCLAAMYASSETFVVIGGGQAGAWIARTLRAEGFDGCVVLIGEEAHWPYERRRCPKPSCRAWLEPSP
jgi:hypothetical protein